jgi:hypothetical protein
MHVADGVDACVAHRRLDSLGRFFDLPFTANLLRQKVPGMRDAHAQSLLAGVPSDALGTRTSREYCYVRRQHPLRPARHDEGDSGLDLARSQLETRGKGVAQCGDGVFAGEVIDPAIAFGLAQHSENGRRLERAAVDERHEPGNVSGSMRWNVDHIERIGLHAPSAWFVRALSSSVPFHLCRRISRLTVARLWARMRQ